MKTLQKLGSKRISSPASIVGGFGSSQDLSMFADADDSGKSCPCTTHKPTKGKLAEHYTCDHTTDDIKC